MNFALILAMACLFTGLLWLADRLVWRKQRGDQAVQPLWLEYTAGLFPVLFLVFVVRSFLFEPFNIPSGSMIPTLRIGDLILVKKFSYGVRLPVVHTKVLSTGQPQRGDVVVFRYPKDESVDYIKRVIGLPGDTVSFVNKAISINGQPVAKTSLGAFDASGASRPALAFREQLGHKQYTTLNDQGAGDFLLLEAFPYRENCERVFGGMRCTVPAGHYFVMGDNRDNSADSRVWGFVPERNLVGQAFLIWFNADEIFSGQFSRLGFFE
ncbi:MAG: signal peptidase [Pseudomonadota bacterium]|jgi:signal peptidase I